MLNIRRLGLFDKHKIKAIIKADGFGGDFKYPVLKEIFCLGQSFLPLKLKFLPETFVCFDKSELKGVISVRPAYGNPERINILQLVFVNNDYNIGKELVNFIVEYYGRLGAKTFKVVIDDTQKELEDLFMHGCGFRCGSWENLWDISNDLKSYENVTTANFSQMNDLYAKEVADLINSELLPYYKPALERKKQEFKSPIVEVFNFKSNNSYLKHFKKNICAYFNIQSTDNKNFVLTPYKNGGYDVSYDEIIGFAVKAISKFRMSDFNLYICQKKNLKFSDELEEYLHSKKYNCINTRHVLIKEFYRPVKQEFRSFIFGENGLLVNR